MKSIVAILKRLGFSDIEASVYLALNQGGQLHVADIARKTGLFRPAVYRALAALEKRALVSAVVGFKQKRYAAAPPAALAGLIDDVTDDFKKMLPEIERAYASSSARPAAVRVLRGREGVRAVFADLVASTPRGGTFYRYTSEKSLDHVNTYLPRAYRTGRDNKRLERQVISNYASGLQKKNRLERGVKFVPKQYDPFEQNVIQLIYANKVAIIDLNTETSVIIESGAVADFHAKLFKLLYHKL